MGARKKHAPRRGSLGVRPRKRAARIVPRIKSWPLVSLEKPRPLAFIGYKAGMTHAFIIDDTPGSMTFGKEIFVPVTIVETPPAFVLAVRVYGYDPNRGLYTLGEAWASREALIKGITEKIEAIGEKPQDDEAKKKRIGEKHVERFEKDLLKKVSRLSLPGSEDVVEKALSKLEAGLSQVYDVRILLASYTRLVGGISKKKPDILEVKIGAPSIEEAFSYARSVLGSLITVDEVFTPGQFVDVIAVTKGKGFQGVIKRFGVKELPRWHKHRKGSRRIGSRGPATSFAWSEVPQPGQTGYHRRTEYNKRILLIGTNGYEITPSGGFLHYGLVETYYVVLHGSIPGPAKRPIVLRYPIRPRWTPEAPPKITYISLQSKQGN